MATTGFIAFPTQTTHYEGSPSKLAYICIVWFPEKMGYLMIPVVGDISCSAVSSFSGDKERIYLKDSEESCHQFDLSSHPPKKSVVSKER